MQEENSTDRLSAFLSQAGASAKSLAKILIQSRRASASKNKGPRQIIIMGNGPSLRQAIDANRQWLMSMPRMAVNFAAITPEFHTLRPEFYIMVDPHFFSGKQEPNLLKLWSELGSVDRPMTMIVPCKEQPKTQMALSSNKNISLATINTVGVEGWKWLRSAAYSHGWGMPRPRNVLIPAIMSAILMGCEEIYLIGADHSWLRTLWVDDANHVVSVQPHFYKEDEREHRRIASEYESYPLHQILDSMRVAFESHHLIQAYASAKGIRIWNCTPSSFIDAFPRLTI